MNQSLIEQGPISTDSIADAFRAMAEKIKHNGINEFGGAVVIVPPQGGEPLHLLILDSQQDVAMFWGNLKAKCGIALASIDQQQRNQQAFRPR